MQFVFLEQKHNFAADLTADTALLDFETQWTSR